MVLPKRWIVDDCHELTKEMKENYSPNYFEGETIKKWPLSHAFEKSFLVQQWKSASVPKLDCETYITIEKISGDKFAPNHWRN